jgi:hypothetical protein
MNRTGVAADNQPPEVVATASSKAKQKSRPFMVVSFRQEKSQHPTGLMTAPNF